MYFIPNIYSRFQTVNSEELVSMKNSKFIKKIQIVSNHQLTLFKNCIERCFEAQIFFLEIIKKKE